MKNRFASTFAVLALVTTGFFQATNASAGITYYTDQSAWQAAVGYYVTEPFNATGLQPFTVVNTTVGSIGPASGVLSGSVWKDDMYNNPYYRSSTTFSYQPGQLFGAGATFDTSVNGDGIGVDIWINGGQQQIGHVQNIHGGFFGWTSTSPFDSVQLSIYYLQFGGGETFDMDNLEFAPVPEPGTTGLIMSGLFALAVLRRSPKTQEKDSCTIL